MTLWVVYCDPNSVWNHMDKYVVNIVSDTDLDVYQRTLAGDKGTTYEVMRNAKHLQQFVIANGNIYYIRQYEFWNPNSSSQYTNNSPPTEQTGRGMLVI